MRKLAPIANRMLSLFTPGAVRLEDGRPYRTFGVGPHAISVVGREHVLELDGTIRQLYDANSDVSSSYSRKTVENVFVEAARRKLQDKFEFTEDELKNIIAELLNRESIEYKVIRDIFGVSLTTPVDPVDIGGFTIFYFPKHKEFLEKQAGLDAEALWFGQSHDYLLQCKVTAREPEKAREIADQRFAQFEQFLSFIIGNPDERFEVGILRYQGRRVRGGYVMGRDRVTNFTEVYGPIEPVPVDHPHLQDPTIGYDRVWGLLQERNPTGMRQRLTLAIEWVGQALIDPAIENAFLKVAIALEIIFTYQENTIITPSILHRISESVAMLLGQAKSDRLQIEKNMKRLYGVRSAIVHAGRKGLSQEDYYELLDYTRTIILDFFRKDRLRECTSVADLHNLIRGVKYTAPGI